MYDQEETGMSIKPQETQADYSAEHARAVQEVQGAIVMAKKFPRNLNQVYDNVLKACKRQRLADQAMYAYKKGSGLVTGPSIRLAETIVRYYGNVDYGIKEVERRGNESDVIAYCWDLETNVRQTKRFTVRHYQDKKGGAKKLTSERDIYEIVANMGARRLRACILGILPADIVEESIDQCNRTLAGNQEVPLTDRVRKMVHAFSEIGVTESMIEKFLGHKLEATVDAQLVTLRKVFNSIKDGMAERGAFFEVPRTEGEAVDRLSERMKKKEVKDEE